MDEMNGRMLACQIMLVALITRVANEARDPLRFITDFRDEVKAVIDGVRIAGHPDAGQIRGAAQRAADELFTLMKPPSQDP